MTLTIEIPVELEQKVQAIPGLKRRMAQFLHQEARLEEIRQQRHSTQARNLVEQALSGADQDKTTGFDWNESFQELRQLHQEITTRL